MKPPRIRTGKAIVVPGRKAPKPKAKPSRKQIATGNRLALAFARGGV